MLSERFRSSWESLGQAAEFGRSLRVWAYVALALNAACAAFLPGDYVGLLVFADVALIGVAGSYFGAPEECRCPCGYRVLLAQRFWDCGECPVCGSKLCDGQMEHFEAMRWSLRAWKWRRKKNLAGGDRQEKALRNDLGQWSALMERRDKFASACLYCGIASLVMIVPAFEADRVFLNGWLMSPAGLNAVYAWGFVSLAVMAAGIWTERRIYCMHCGEYRPQEDLAYKNSGICRECGKKLG